VTLRRGAAAAAALLAAGLVAAGAPAVHLRVEGAEGTLWRGWVEAAALEVEAMGGRTYAVAPATPLAALAASPLPLLLDDQWAGWDLSVHGVGGENSTGTSWWDYRVDDVGTYYGPDRGWRAYGPRPLAAGDRVTWYRESVGLRPLRLDAQPLAQGPSCAWLVALRELQPDLHHHAGQPWPPPGVWVPAPGELRGDLADPLPAGGAVVQPPPGRSVVWGERAAALQEGMPALRSDVVELVCP
jgi:hypothetical protein